MNGFSALSDAEESVDEIAGVFSGDSLRHEHRFSTSTVQFMQKQIFSVRCSLFTLPLLHFKFLCKKSIISGKPYTVS